MFSSAQVIYLLLILLNSENYGEQVQITSSTGEASLMIARARKGLRGHTHMTSAKISDFLTPSPPCPQIHATSLTKVAYYVCF